MRDSTWRQTWNYLRVRGEYSTEFTVARWYLELPPRARRIRGCGFPDQGLEGTTSACAENTFPGAEQFGEFGNYLRVRGEYQVISGTC